LIGGEARPVIPQAQSIVEQSRVNELMRRLDKGFKM